MMNWIRLERFLALGVFLAVINSGGHAEEKSTAAPLIHAWESFTYPLDIFTQPPNFAGHSIAGGTGGINVQDNRGEGGWTSAWILEATEIVAVLDETPLDTERMAHQDPFFYPGSFSLKISTTAVDGPMRRFPEADAGELWISFLFQDSIAVSSSSGLVIRGATGADGVLIGKPAGSEFLGLASPPAAKSSWLTAVPYNEPHHLMVRVVLDPAPGRLDDVFLWVDPTEADRLDTYQAGGEDIVEIESLGAIQLRRSSAAGNAYFDDLVISSRPSLPPAGTVRIDLGFDPASPLRRNPAVVLHDVISIDQYRDARTGPGYGLSDEQNEFLVVEGFIYFSAFGESRVARGVPFDRLSGLGGFALAPFNDSLGDVTSTSGWKNALRFHSGNGTKVPVSFDVPSGPYAQCRVLTTGDGHATLRAVFHFADGTSEEKAFRSADWLADPEEGGDENAPPPDLVQIRNHMNYLDGDSLFVGSDPLTGEDANHDDACFFSDRVPLPMDKNLIRIELGPASNGTVNLFDLLLDTRLDETAVPDWMLH
ncbi:MAG TPA: hypothetical protein PK878_01190 [bacterium]|nr:hypothetical protein [Candidatus Omnitrophota bacterium]HOJ58876.1 hypothetical protein [bacterium]HPO99822.1 hypothetical protein [bacterium]HXK95441.1 hypothetical protein [bacterium]